MIDFDALAATSLQQAPYDWALVEGAFDRERTIVRASRAIVQERHDLERYAAECSGMLRSIALGSTLTDESGTELPAARTQQYA